MEIHALSPQESFSFKKLKAYHWFVSAAANEAVYLGSPTQALK